MNVVLLGPPGAGKGTQAARVKEEFGLVHISTGDILRSAAAEGTELGKRAKAYMDRGELVPDQAVVAIVTERLGRDDCREKGWLLDGFPRNLPQEEALEGTIRTSGLAPVDTVLYLKIPAEVVVERLARRRSCPACGAVYHVKHMPPSRDGLCDRCGGKLVHRDDDKPETVRQRLATYESQTAELVDHYRRRGLLSEMPGGGAPEEVWRAIEATLRRVGIGSGG